MGGTDRSKKSKKKTEKGMKRTMKGEVEKGRREKVGQQIGMMRRSESRRRSR